MPVFGRDPARYRVLSPIAQVGGKDVGDWLLLYAGARPDAAKQSALLAAALRRAGRKAQRVMVPSSTPNPVAAHREINETFGTAGFAANAAIEALMKRVAGK